MAFATNGISARDLYLWMAAYLDELEDLGESSERRLADHAWIRVIEAMDGVRTEASARAWVRMALKNGQPGSAAKR